MSLMHPDRGHSKSLSPKSVKTSHDGQKKLTVGGTNISKQADQMHGNTWML